MMKSAPPNVTNGSLDCFPCGIARNTGIITLNMGHSDWTSTQIRDSVMKRFDLWHSNHILWAGRNNFADSAQVLSDLQAMVNITTSNGGTVVMIMGVMKSNGQKTGTKDASDINELNNLIKARWPAKYFDPQAFIVTMANSNLDNDVADAKAGVTPRSLRRDGLHLNDIGNRYLADTVSKILLTRVTR